MSPGGVNDVLREIMASVRRWYEDAQWIDFGVTPLRVSATSFSIIGDYTGAFVRGRRIRGNKSPPVGQIVSSSYEVNNNRTTVVVDGVIPNPLTSVQVSILTVDGVPMNAFTSLVPGTGMVIKPDEDSLTVTPDYYLRSQIDDTFITKQAATDAFMESTGGDFTGAITVNGATVWTASNDGNGSGLDADTVRGEVLNPVNGIVGANVDQINHIRIPPGVSIYFGRISGPSQGEKDITVSPPVTFPILALAGYPSQASGWAPSARWINPTTIRIGSGHYAEEISFIAIGT
jgi:hypothetical protein